MLSALNNSTRAIAVLLFLIVGAAYLPVINCGFVNFDDNSHVVTNPVVVNGLTTHGIKAAFVEPHAGLWIPLTWLSLMVDVSLFGMSAAALHSVNVLFHVANSIVLFFLLDRMTGRRWPSAIVAACFGVHPLNVESVAWITERKNVLCGLFFFLCLYAYQNFVTRPRRSAYLWTWFLAVLAILAKPMAVTIPFVLLLLDYWPLQRFRNVPWKTLILEKIPFLFLSATSSLITFFSARAAAGDDLAKTITMENRVRNALVSYVDYIADIFWPSDLAVLYPHPYVIGWYPTLVAFTVIAGITAVAFLLRHRFRYLLWGWLWFLGILVPTIGLVQVGPQARADRFTYISQIGIFIGVIFLISELPLGRLRKGLPFVAGGILAILFGLTGRQIGYWTSTTDLFEHTARVTKRNTRAFVQAGAARVAMGDYSTAAAHFQEAVKLHPELEYLWTNLGICFENLKKEEEARRCFLRALSIKPDAIETILVLARWSERNGDIPSAIVYTEKAIPLSPKSPELHQHLGELLTKNGEAERARIHLETATKLSNRE